MSKERRPFACAICGPRAPRLGDRLYTEVRGQGDAVVFLAGLTATTHFWQGAFDPLAKTHRLIFVDALGFGQSPLPEVSREALLHTWQSFNGTLRNVVLTKPVATALARILALHFAGPQAAAEDAAIQLPDRGGLQSGRGRSRDWPPKLSIPPGTHREGMTEESMQPQPRCTAPLSEQMGCDLKEMQ